MMAAFLDALGIAHEDGLIKEDDVKPDAEKIARGGRPAAIAVSYRGRGLYLNTLLCQDPETWGALADHVATA